MSPDSFRQRSKGLLEQAMFGRRGAFEQVLVILRQVVRYHLFELANAGCINNNIRLAGSALHGLVFPGIFHKINPAIGIMSPCSKLVK